MTHRLSLIDHDNKNSSKYVLPSSEMLSLYHTEVAMTHFNVKMRLWLRVKNNMIVNDSKLKKVNDYLLTISRN